MKHQENNKKYMMYFKDTILIPLDDRDGAKDIREIIVDSNGTTYGELLKRNENDYHIIFDNHSKKVRYKQINNAIAQTKKESKESIIEKKRAISALRLLKISPHRIEYHRNRVLCGSTARNGLSYICNRNKNHVFYSYESLSGAICRIPGCKGKLRVLRR